MAGPKLFRQIQSFCHPNRRHRDEIRRKYGATKAVRAALTHCTRQGYLRKMQGDYYLATDIGTVEPKADALDALSEAFGIRRPASLAGFQWRQPWQAMEDASA